MRTLLELRQFNGFPGLTFGARFTQRIARGPWFVPRGRRDPIRRGASSASDDSAVEWPKIFGAMHESRGARSGRLTTNEIHTMQIPEALISKRGTVRSSDGTALTYICIGSGTPLVVCHGAFSVAQDWVPFAERIGPKHSVFLYDRRGRGQSPHAGPRFAIDAEVHDLAAMVELAGRETAVLGHSFGGGCALSFAARAKFSGSLIVYEPRHSVLEPVSKGQINEIERLIAEGDKDTAAQFVMRHVIGMPAQAVVGLRGSPLWDTVCRTVDAFPNELRFLDSLTWRSGDLDGIATSPTLLVGEQSPVLPDEISADLALRSLLPSMRTVSIPGQGHFAFLSDPALLADIVSKCLGSPA